MKKPKGPAVGTPSNARHLSKSAEWGTPLDWIEIARKVLGGFDLDPASSDFWNLAVGATRFIDKHEDGLRALWSLDGRPVRVFCNPPGDVTGALVAAFWARLSAKWRSGEVSSAWWVGFSLEQLGYLQDSPVCPLRLPTVVPRTRKGYREFVDGVAIIAEQPTHGSYLTLLPDRRTGADQIRTMRALTENIGRIVNAR